MDAPSERTLANSALIGMTSDPVIRNSSVTVPSTMTSAAHGMPPSSESEKSTVRASAPVTQCREVRPVRADLAHDGAAGLALDDHRVSATRR